VVLQSFVQLCDEEVKPLNGLAPIKDPIASALEVMSPKWR